MEYDDRIDDITALVAFIDAASMSGWPHPWEQAIEEAPTLNAVLTLGH